MVIHDLYDLCINSATMAHSDSQYNLRVPIWNGDAANFAQYKTDIEWFVAGTPKDKRPYVVGKLVANIPAGPLKTLVQSWRAASFETPTGHELYIKRLEESPLMRRTLPQASTTMSKFYTYVRRPGQTMGEYLIGEDSPNRASL